jgi:hypothetical protein
MGKLEFLDRQTECWALLREAGGAKGRSLAIFVHGFRGNYLTTWGRLPEFLCDYASNDPVLKHWDFLFMGYATRQVASYLDIASLIATQWAKAASGTPPFVGPYKRLALFGHSLGTLGIRQLLCAVGMHRKGMLKALHGVTLFGTPLNGSPLALFGGTLIGGKIAESLKPGNPQLRMLKAWIDSVHPHLKWGKVRIVLGIGDGVVGDKYSELIKFVGDAEPCKLSFDHGTLVRPKSWHGSSICDEIVGALK